MKAKRSHNDKLQSERLSRGWKQEEIAEKLGVDLRTVRRWECGYPVRPLNIAGLTRLFGKSSGELGLIEEEAAETLAETSPPLNKDVETSPNDSPEYAPTQKNVVGSLLPLQPTTLIGREQEIAKVKQLLCHQEVRLLTLTGPGGVGKTCLGVQVAHELRDAFPDGVFFVSLVFIREVSSVPAAIAQALGIWEVSGQSLLESLKTYLRKKQMLLLLDNFEQVVSAADQVAELLAVCPILKILVTSRQILHIRAEYEFLVPPLALPDRFSLSIQPDLVTLSRNPAVELFVQRAQAINPNFQATVANVTTVAEICIRLDGLPLAIELAAYSKILLPQALLTRLESRPLVLTGGSKVLPFKQQTLRNTITWSYDLLNSHEQRLFRWLSIFIGGFTLEAVVEFGVLLGETATSVLDRVDSLLDKSLLQLVKQNGKEGQRFIMLETIREYGLEALAFHGEMEEIQRSHALTYLALAEQADLELFGPQQSMWLERLERESGNLRAAIQWWLEQPDSDSVERALRMGGALQQFWEVRGYRNEGRKFLQEALAAKAEVAPSVRAKALDAAIVLAVNQGDLDQALVLCEENLILCRAYQDERGIALSLHRLAGIAWSQGKLLEASSMYEGALALFRKLGDKWGIAASIEGTAFIALDQADYDRAHALYQETLAIREERLGGEHPDTATSLNNLANLYAQQSKYTQAEPLYQRALAIKEQQLGSNHPDTAGCLNSLASLYIQQAKYTDAEPLFKRAIAIHEQKLGSNHPDIAQSLNGLASLYIQQGKYTDAESLFKRALASREQQLVPNHPDIAQSLNGLASLYIQQGKYTDAELLCQRALAICEQRLGSEHPDTATSLNNLAELYFKQAKHSEAEKHFRQALQILEKSFGPIHPYVSTVLNNLASVAQAEKKFREAQKLYQRVLATDLEVFGDSHPTLATDFNNLASLCYRTGQLEEAERYYRRALLIDEQVRGDNHPILAVRLNNLGSLLLATKRIKEAKSLLQRAYNILKDNDKKDTFLQQEVQMKLEALQ